MPVDANSLLLRFDGPPSEIVRGPSPRTVDFFPTLLHGLFHAADGGTQIRNLSGDGSNWSYAALTDAPGEWIAVLGKAAPTDNREFLVLGDYFGHQRIFFASWAQGVFVSTDYDTIAHARLSGGASGINWGYAAPTLASQNVFCAGAWARQNMHHDIHELFPGEALWVRPGQVTVFAKPFRTSKQELSYEELLDRGIARAIRGLQRTAADQDREIRITLSGGRDSRVVLALALAAGLKDRLRITSADPASFSGASKEVVLNDLRIAQAIGEDYGLINAIDTEHEFRTQTFDSLLYEFQRAKSGASYNPPGNLALAVPLIPRIELHGGSGELLRAAFRAWPETGWWRRLIKDTPDQLSSDAQKLLSIITRPAVLTPGQAQEATAILREALKEGDATTLSEGLNNHYQAHRNRWHFGHRLSALSQRKLLLFPLEQPEFFQAANLLDFELRSAGLAAFDIINRLMPDLNAYPFDNAPTWPQPILDARLGGRSPASRTGEPTADRLSKASATLKSNAHIRVRAAVPVEGKAADFAANRALRYLEALHSYAPQQFPVVSRNKFAGMLRDGKLNPLQTVSRLHSVLAPALPLDAEHPPHTITWDLFARGSARHNTYNPADVYPPTAVTDASVLDVLVDLQATRAEGEVVATATVTPSMSASKTSWRYAFYLLRGTERLGTRWYDANPQARFTLTETDSHEALTVRVFIHRDTEEDQLPLIRTVEVKT